LGRQALTKTLHSCARNYIGSSPKERLAKAIDGIIYPMTEDGGNINVDRDVGESGLCEDEPNLLIKEVAFRAWDMTSNLIN